MNRKHFILAATLCVAASLSLSPSFAADEIELQVSLKDHVFSPSDFKVPAGRVILFTVRNEDPTPEEFDSHDLRVEKVIAGNSQAIVRVGPLDPGQYYYMGEYNEATAFGHVTAE